MKQKEYKIPDLDTCKRYLPEAAAIDDMPEDETEVVSFDLGEKTTNYLQAIADEWNVPVEHVMRTMLIALVKGNEE